MKWNCEEVPYQIHCMFCSSSVGSDQRKEIVKKHWLSGVENCEMESVQKKKKELVMTCQKDSLIRV